MNSTESLITVPLGRKAHATAEQFAVQATSQKRKQIYLNTLAVYAVHSYLNWLQVESSLGQGESWSPGLQSLSNVADLFLPGVGALECRSVLPGETSFVIPPQATEDRIGYVAVQLNESLNQAELLGFLSAIAASNAPKQIPLTRLQPLDVLLDTLPATTQTSTILRQVPVNLSHWLENVFEVGWLTVEALFSTKSANPALQVRNEQQLQEITADIAPGVKRGKLINLGIQMAGNSVALIVTCEPADEELDIRLQVYSANGSILLPPNLQLTVLDETGTTVPELQVQARSADNCIQLEFTGKPGEQFSVKLALGDDSITEDFQI